LLPSFDFENVTDKEFAERLAEILKAVRYLNPEFLISGSYRVQTLLDFNPEFGFGSSSTLIANLARWAGVDAFELQKLTFKGSGYDVAVALEKKPIVYALQQNKPVYHSVKFNPAFSNNLFFVYLGKKRRSMEAVKQFKKTAVFAQSDIDAVTAITREIINCNSLQQFEKLLKEHELLMSKVLKTATTGKQLFNNYTEGVVKSMGAWGGDFVLITSQQKPEVFKQNMQQYGFKTIYSFHDLALTE
jgi:mevalonate kinase